MFCCLRINSRNILALCMILVVLAASCAFADFDTDPFYDQRVKLDAPPIEAISEHIDPFSGNMQIVQTDLHLPGSGGLDLTIMRSYNSLIYSRYDDALNRLPKSAGEDTGNQHLLSFSDRSSRRGYGRTDDSAPGVELFGRGNSIKIHHLGRRL